MSTEKNFMDVSSTEEINENERSNELEVGVKLNQMLDIVTENIDEPITEETDSTRSGKNVNGFKDKLTASIADILRAEKNDQRRCFDKTNHFEIIFETNGDSETAGEERELPDNLINKPSTSVINNNENTNLSSFKLDHVYNRTEPPPKIVEIENLKMHDIAASLLMLGEKKQSRKRKKLDSSNSRTNENDVNPSNTEANPTKRKRNQCFFKKPMNNSARCVEPFKKGWKRELVHRMSGVSETTQHADVYYFSPLGVKLRSYREVADYLKEINEDSLSLDCFTYKKVLIYQTPEEIERNAGEGGSKGTYYRKKRTTAISPSTSAPKAPSKAPKQPHQPSLLSKIKKIGTANKKINKKINKTVKKVKLDSVPCSLSCPGQQGIVPTLLCDICLCMFHPRCVNLTSDTASFICIKCIYQRTYVNKKQREKHTGQGPELPSDSNHKNGADIEVDSDNETPVTVEVRSSIISNNNDVKRIEVAPSYHVLPRLTPAPQGNKTYSKLEGQADTNRPLPPLKRAQFALNQPLKPVKISGTWVPPNQLPPKTIPLRQPPPLKMVMLPRKDTVAGPVIIRPPPPLMQQRSMVPVSSQSRLLMVPISVPSMSNILRPNAPNVQAPGSPSLPLDLTSSSTVSTSAASPKPGVVTMINNMVINNMVMNNVGTMKFRLKTNSGNVTEVLVPEIKPTNATTPPQPKYIVTDKFGKPNGLVVGFGNSVIQLPILNKIESYQRETSGGIISVPLPNSSSSILMPKLLTTSKAEEAKTPNEVAVGLTKEAETQSDGVEKVVREDSTSDLKDDEPKKRDLGSIVRNIQRCFAGTTALLKVFEYLTHEDLSRARCVSKSWNWWASQSDLWTSIDLSGTCVHDWNKLAGLIRQFKSTRLDLRKMKVYEDQNRTWHCFLLVLKDLEMIDHIDFGHIPGAFLPPIARSLTRLKVLTAEWIVEYTNNNCRLDFGIFGKLKCLRKLRLRGISGLQVQNITTEGLSSLEDLKQLVHLSITTLRDAPASDFEVIKSLKQLKELDLGDCKNWTAETYNYLSELTELERLRLEVGTAFPDDLCYPSLSKLIKLTYLELNDFQINKNLIPVLEHLPQLEHLNILPNCGQDSESTNTIIFEGLQGLKNLKILEWKIMTKTTTVNNSTNLNNDVDELTISPSSVDNCESQRDKVIIKENDACIPFVLNSESKYITIDELWDKVKTVCSNVIFH